MTMVKTAASSPALRPHSLLHSWPGALGLLAAGMVIATGANRGTAAVTVGLATLCYLAAAAVGVPWVAWAAIVPGTLIVFASEAAGLAWWIGVGVAALVLIVIGLLRQVSRWVLLAQVAAMLVFGGAAVLALSVAPRVGLVIAGAVLATHAVWDLIHHRRNQVVPRSLAEFCLLLDVPLGIGVIVLGVLS